MRLYGLWATAPNDVWTVGANGTIVAERKPVAGKDRQEIIVDLRDRRLLIHYTTKEAIDVKSTILVGVSRRSKFDRLQDEFNALIQPEYSLT